MEVKIKQANPEDLKTIRELNKMLAKHIRAFEPWVKEEWSFSREGTVYFKRRISKINEGFIFLATFENKSLGI